MLLGVFVAVIEAQKLEVCIHKQNCMVEKLSEIQFTNVSDDIVSISIKLWEPSRQKFQLWIWSYYYVKEMLVRLNTCMHAIFKKPLNLANEILNLAQVVCNNITFKEMFSKIVN